jgi:endonuclease/exonuclease/phosphatase (EEP) superfamily protein YafD
MNMPESSGTRLLRLSRRSAVAAGLGYTAAVVGYTLARPLTGRRQGWIELVDDLAPWAYLGGPALVGLGALVRSRDLLLAGAGLCAAFGLQWGGRYLRPARPVASADAELRVMTFNALAWQRRGDDLVASIRAANADIVGLQEVGTNAVSHLVEALADRFPYHAEEPSPDSSGTAVFSRFPIADARTIRITEKSHWWQSMTIETPFGEIAYLNVHVRIPRVEKFSVPLGSVRVPRSFHSQRRTMEIRELDRLIQVETRPLIVTGDFNMTERSADYACVASRLRDAYRAVGRGLGHTFPRVGSLPRSFPAPWPVLRLDYVWHSDHFEAMSATIGDSGESDHHPVIVDLRRRDPAAQVGATVPLAASAV